MLFKDTNKLKEFAQLAGEVNFAGIQPTIRLVEQKYILTVLGKELYTELDEAYKAAANESALSDRLKDLLLQCRMVIGPMFCVAYAPKADVQLGDAGMQRQETGTSKTAYQYQGTKFIEANLREGEEAGELLLQFLEDNKDDYPTWVDSDQFKEYRSMFIKTGGEFNVYFPSASPYRNYWAMRQKMVDVEQIHIKKILGDDLYNSLKEKTIAAEQTTNETEDQLLFKLKKAIANLTIAFAMPVLNVRINANGLSVLAAASFSTNDNENTRQQITDKTYTTFRDACINAAQEWIKDAQDFITAHKEDFASWIGFVTTESKCVKSNNKDFNTTFGLF